MWRAESIAEAGFENGRNPLDTAGMDTDDEVWVYEHPEYEDYIMDHYRQLQEEERRAEEEEEEEEERRYEEMKKLQKAKQNLAFSRSIIDPSSILFKNLKYEPSIIDNIHKETEYLYYPYVQRRVYNEMVTNDMIANYLDNLDQYGSSRSRRKRTMRK